jgi:uncharacterized protein YkwD
MAVSEQTKTVNTTEDGVFFNLALHHHHDDCNKNETSKSTIDTEPCITLESSPSESSSTRSLPMSWKTTGTNSFLRNAPLLVCDPDLSGDDQAPIENAAQKLGEIISRSKQHLPKESQYSSNHVMVNYYRIQRCAAPLLRLSELDEIARAHASAMASADRLFHIDPMQLRQSFHHPTRRMGENIAKGNTIRDIHRAMIETSISDRNNIIDRRYTHMGMGTATCHQDGQLYLCQVFRG